VASYGQIARLVPLPPGVDPDAYRAFGARWVGAALAACPGDVPWQRVLNARGEISLRAGAEHQRRLLEAEGVIFDAKGRVDLQRFGWAG
jgi:methylated-DNA-protein-cysteine methyltransferase-like protein